MKKLILLLACILSSLFLLAQENTPSDNNCLHLDGINDYVSIPHTPSQVAGSQPYTLEVWAESPDINQFGTIITKRDSFACYEQVSLYLNDGTDPIQVPTPGKKISFSYGRSGLKANSNCGDGYRVITTQNDIIDGNFHHIAAVVDPSNQSIVLYVDGVLQPVDLIQYGPFPVLNHTAPYTIGRMADHLAWYEGTIDEVRIWNIARTQTEIQNDMNHELVGNEPGLVAYYNFNQGVGGGVNTSISTLGDVTSNANNGSINNFALTGSTSNFINCETVSSNTNTDIDFRNEDNLGQIKIFPNPSSGLVNIMVENPENKDIRVLVFDSAGREVWQSEKIKGEKDWIGKFEVFQSGIYFVRIQLGNKFVYKRVVKI